MGKIVDCQEASVKFIAIRVKRTTKQEEIEFSISGQLSKNALDRPILFDYLTPPPSGTFGHGLDLAPATLSDLPALYSSLTGERSSEMERVPQLCLSSPNSRLE